MTSKNQSQGDGAGAPRPGTGRPIVFKLQQGDTRRNSTPELNQSQAPIMMAAVRAGLQKAYQDGQEFMRNKIEETEKEVEKIRMSYYCCEEPDPNRYEEFLKKCNDNFLQANNELRRKNIKLEVIDCEIRIVALLNQLRDVAEMDRGEIAFLTKYWENIKQTLEHLRFLVEKFQTSVLERLQANCISYNSADIHLDVSNRYTEQISTFLTEIDRNLTNTQLLLKSFSSGIHQDLFSKSDFSERILVSCDLKAFPILRLIPDLTEKVLAMCSIARKWLESDEKYMCEINNYIKETRSITKKRAEVLRNQREKRKKVEKALKAAHILLYNNKEKLQHIETELNTLEEQLSGYRHAKKSKYTEKQHKESMVDFLKITLSQTKRNYTLQMKRQRLLKQVKNLEGFLVGIERDLSDVQDRIVVKAQQKELLAEKMENTQRTYGALKTDLDRFSDNLEKLEQEVNGLSGQLLQLEIIQTYKTSPEKVDEIFDRPQTVKLAPSLKEKIKRRRRVLTRAQ